MIDRNLGKILIALTVVAVLGFGANAFAGWGMGYGHGWGHGRGMAYDRGWSDESGMGYGPGMGYGRGMGRDFGRFGYASDLSEEDLKKLDEEKTAVGRGFGRRGRGFGAGFGGPCWR